MTRKDLRGHLQDFYRRERMPPVRIRLTELVSDRSSPGATSRRRRWTRAAGGAALILLGALGLLRAAGIRFPTGSGVVDPAPAFAEELAAHHHKRFGVEFPAADFVELRRAMSRLGFTVVTPAGFLDWNVRLVGGRYCAFRGQSMAQIHLEDPDGAPWTLFQTRLPDAIDPGRPGAFTIDGLDVHVWKERGLLMGLARAVP